MSLQLFNDPYDYYRPSKIYDQHFGLGLEPEDLFSPFIPRDLYKGRTRCPAGYLRPWRANSSMQDVGSTVSVNKDQFQANLDVQQFRPDEITVKLTGGNTVTVEGKHEEKQDEHGSVSRHFVRKYVIPHDYDVNKVESKLSSDGVLTIASPKTEANEDECKSIPIKQTGQPSKPIEQKKEEDKPKSN